MLFIKNPKSLDLRAADRTEVKRLTGCNSFVLKSLFHWFNSLVLELAVCFAIGFRKGARHLGLCWPWWSARFSVYMGVYMIKVSCTVLGCFLLSLKTCHIIVWKNCNLIIFPYCYALLTTMCLRLSCEGMQCMGYWATWSWSFFTSWFAFHSYLSSWALRGGWMMSPTQEAEMNSLLSQAHAWRW